MTFVNGFAVEAFETATERDGAFAKPTLFTTEAGTLRPHTITQGRRAGEAVTRVRMFTGQVFQASAQAVPLLVAPRNFIMLMPEKAWQFSPDTPRIPAGGWFQGAVMGVGSGRTAFFGEAAMFTANVAGPARIPIGMNAPGAEQNFQFVLNVMRWLAAASENAATVVSAIVGGLASPTR